MQNNEIQFIKYKLVLHSSLYLFFKINDFFFLQNLKTSTETENSYVDLNEKAIK